MVIDGGVEKATCFLRLKEAYEISGRLEVCGCTDDCEARRRILQYIGLTVELVFKLHEAGYTMTVQQLNLSSSTG